MSRERPKLEPRVQLAVRNADCSDCRMCGQAAGLDVCVTATGSHTARVLVVAKMPYSANGIREMTTYMSRAGFNMQEVAFTSAIKCRTWELSPTRTDIKTCKHYLADEVAFIKPEIILCLGNEALQSVTGKSGIMKHRGVTYDGLHGVKTIATISPAMVHRNPGQKDGFEADLRYVAAVLEGRDLESEHTPKDFRVADDKTSLKQMIRDIRGAQGVSFDIESTGFDEFAPESRIVCIAFTLWGDDNGALGTTWALPLYHPESPWRTQWKKVLKLVGQCVTECKKRIAHNGKFDCRWLRQFGWPKIDVSFDTMLAAHTLDENRPKGLKPLAQSILGAPPWAIDTKDLLSESLAKVLEYCGLDTFHAARLYFHFREQLKLVENAKKARLFARLIMPAANEFIATERYGVWVDRPQLMTNWRVAEAELAAINEKLREYVPDDHPFVKEYRDGRTDVEVNINFGPSNFLRWFIFEHLELPVISRGKPKDNGEPGAPSLAEHVMLALKGLHPVIDLLLERSKWWKYTTAFFSAYAEQLDTEDRIHTTFKVTGTVTGRLSSGKPDAEKVTSKKQIRGANLQQVPRDKFVRGIFGAPPGFTFVEFDYSQIELRIAAFLARERTMLALYNQGFDIHMAMAMRMTGKPKSEVTPHERKMAKAVNFGFLYGMGWLKFMGTALSNYQILVSKETAQAARAAFFDQFPDLIPWHAKQRRLVRIYKRVETPFGRVRHLPDIDSEDQGVRAEAERQAINSPVQGFASDLALLSFILSSREMRKRGLQARAIGTVHDAVNWEVPNHELATVLPIVKDTMENLPLQKLFGIRLDIPIIADAKCGLRWGGAEEIPGEVITDGDALRMWLQDRDFVGKERRPA